MKCLRATRRDTLRSDNCQETRDRCHRVGLRLNWAAQACLRDMSHAPQYLSLPILHGAFAALQSFLAD